MNLPSAARWRSPRSFAPMRLFPPTNQDEAQKIRSGPDLIFRSLRATPTRPKGPARSFLVTRSVQALIYPLNRRASVLVATPSRFPATVSYAFRLVLVFMYSIFL